MKPLTLEETRLKEEMKARCLAKGQYVDENAKAKFDMLCHLENFEVQYWELQQENKILKENAENNDKVVDKINWNNQLLNKENKKLKDKLSKVETLIINHNCDIGDIYYKYNKKFLKSELKQRILKILYEESDNNQ